MKHLITAMLLVTTAACTHSSPSDGAMTSSPVATDIDEATERVASVVRAARRARTVRPLQPRLQPETIASQVLREANIERRRAGSPALESDLRLDRAAVRYSRELAGRHEIEHVSSTPGLETFRNRIEAEGVNPRIAGENLARLTASHRTAARRTVEAWMRSPGHRSNMLDDIFTRTGIGVTLGEDGIWYVVQYYATGEEE